MTLPRPLARSRLPLFAWLVSIGVAQAGAAFALALLVERGFDLLVGGTTPVRTPVVAALGGGMLLAVVVAAVARGTERMAAERLGQHYVLDLREALFAHLTRVPARVLARRHRGSMLLRFVGDLSALRQWVSLGLARLLVGGVAVGAAVTGLCFLNLALGLAVGGVLLTGALATWAVSPRLLTTSRRARRRRARLTGEVTERLTQLAVLQSAGQERRERRRVSRKSTRVAAAMVSYATASGVARAVAEGAAGAAGVAALLAGAIEVRAGRASPGTVVAAVSVVGLLSGHLRDLGRVAEYAAAARVARDAVRRFFDLPTLPDPPGLPDLVVTGVALDVEDVTVEGALSGVSVRAEPGSRVAVVGPNGAGKSTLVTVLTRLIDPDAGRVLVDGQDLASCNLASVRRSMGVANPDLPLLRGSMERNVRYRLPRVDDDELARVTKLCDLDGVAADLPDGWRTDVGEGGARLSSGQRARLSIARAALGRPPLLVLDEPEAHLDARAAEVVDRVLADHVGTAVVVTHSRARVERADVVWCLVDGRVVEVGPPGPLLAGGGPTARLLDAPPRPRPYALAAASTSDDGE